jgi:hypothetical protein
MGAKRMVAMALGLGALMASGALAGTGSQGSDNDGSKRVCRNITPSGSRLTTRICRTKAEWDAIRDKTQQGMLEQQVERQSGFESPPPR